MCNNMKFINLISRLNPNKWGHADERPPRAVLAVTLAAMFLLFATWAISSPVGSSNDETFHLASMWCSGQGDSDCQVPKFIAAAPCFSEKPELTPACRTADDKKLESTERFRRTGVQQGLLYYKVAGSIISDDLESSVIRLRIINSLIATLMFGATIFLGWGRLSRAFLIAFCATAVPLGLFLIPSVNPQSWLYIGSFSSWVLIWLALTEKGKTHAIWSTIFSLFAAGLSIASRSDGLPVLAVITFFIAVLSWREKLLVCSRLLLVLTTGFAFILLLKVPMISRKSFSLVNDSSSIFSGYYTMHNLPRMLEFYFGDFGTRIGDSDTNLPMTVILSTFFLFIFFFIWILQHVDKFRMSVSAGLLAMLIFLPIIVLNDARYQIGGLFLPRYMLPYLFGFIFILASSRNMTLKSFSIREVTLIGAAFISSVVGAQFTLIKRYTVSAESTSWNLNSDKLWWWSSGPSPLSTVLIGGISATLMILGVIYLIYSSEQNKRTAI